MVKSQVSRFALRIAVASGKGGTGKTTVATSLALSLCGAAGFPIRSPETSPVLFLDCDVEAPNAHIFLRPELSERRDVGVLVPVVDESACTHCGKCAEVCQHHAIAVLGKKTVVFPQLCHGCGSCSLVCPEKAIHETLHLIGRLERGQTPAGIEFGRGVLNIGEPMAVPIIRQLKSWSTARPGQPVILDVPPGTSCPVVESMRGADFLLLVTEPTPFGLHDLQLAVQVGEELKIPAGVIINRWDENRLGECVSALETFCEQNNLPVLMRIPYDRQIAEGIARGNALVEIRPDMVHKFQHLYDRIGLACEEASQA